MVRPKQPGLTENELDVMRVLWSKAPLKIGEILENLKRQPKPAYTSLLTLVQTMERKNYLSHVKDGKAFAYSPVLKKQFFFDTEIKRVAKRLFNDRPFALVVSLVKDEHLSKEEIRELKKLLADK